MSAKFEKKYRTDIREKHRDTDCGDEKSSHFSLGSSNYLWRENSLFHDADKERESAKPSHRTGVEVSELKIMHEARVAHD